MLETNSILDTTNFTGYKLAQYNHANKILKKLFVISASEGLKWVTPNAIYDKESGILTVVLFNTKNLKTFVLSIYPRSECRVTLSEQGILIKNAMVEKIDDRKMWREYLGWWSKCTTFKG